MASATMGMTFFSLAIHLAAGVLIAMGRLRAWGFGESGLADGCWRCADVAQRETTPGTGACSQPLLDFTEFSDLMPFFWVLPVKCDILIVSCQ